MPPVGTSGMSGSGARTSRRYRAPPNDAGKSLTAAAPERQAATISVGVKAPGRHGTPRAAASSTSSGTALGETRNAAPASMQALASSVVSTVPAPMQADPPYVATSDAIVATAPGVVS